MRPLQLPDLLRSLPRGAAILDVGCFGYRQWAACERIGRSDVRHCGVDYNDYDEIPPGFTYRKADLSRDAIPFPDDEFDLVVANHVIEHVADGARLVGDCVRVCKPGGIVYVEAPSERSLWLPGMPFEHDKFFSTSFFDDPTHVGRPWSPQSLIRLGRYLGCEPIEAGYRTSRSPRTFARLAKGIVLRRGGLVESALWGLVGWASYMALKKPPELRGAPGFRYYIPQDR